MYFKIKTTGLDPNKASVYLVTWLDPKTQDTRSHLLPSLDQERSFLEEVFDQGPKAITTFRGSQFDLKFLSQKLASLSLKVYQPNHRDLYSIQKFFEHFQDFPCRTRSCWQTYYSKSRALNYKEEQTYLEALYLDGSLEAKKALIQAGIDEVAWYPKLDQSLRRLEKDFKVLSPYSIQKLDLSGDSLIVKGDCPLENLVNYGERDWLEVRDKKFTYSLLLNRGLVGKEEALYLILPPLKRLALRTLPLDSRVLILKLGQNYIKEDTIQVLKNRLEKLTLL